MISLAGILFNIDNISPAVIGPVTLNGTNSPISGLISSGAISSIFENLNIASVLRNLSV